MGRSESHQVTEQSLAQSQQDQNNAQTALGQTNSAVTGYNNNLNNFLKFGRQVYGTNGEYMRDQNTLANETASAGATATGGDLALNNMRTGENTAGYATTEAAAKNQASQNVENDLAQADANRLQQLTAVNQYGVQASALPAEVYSSLYGSSLSGTSGQSSAAANAAKTPGFWDSFLPAIAQGAGEAFQGAGTAAVACWIAAALYGGWDDPRTILVRAWLNTEFNKTWFGRLAMLVYLRYGQSVAASLPRRPRLNRLLRWVFDRALSRARRWDENQKRLEETQTAPSVRAAQAR